MNVKSTRRLTGREVRSLDPYMLMAVLGKRVIHPGGKLSTEELPGRADFAAGQRVLDVGCGVGTTAIEIARRYGARVTAVDISPPHAQASSVQCSRGGRRGEGHRGKRRHPGLALP